MTDQIAQLASQQVQEPQPAPQPVQAPVQVVNQQSSAPVQSVPYDRFQQVIQQKNEMAQRLAAYEAQQQAQVAQQPASQINTVDDLLNVVMSSVDQKLNQAYDTKLKPIEEHVTKTNLVANVERFYAGQPEAAKVRGQIDQYFDTLTPDYQNFIKQSIVKGDTSVMNNLYYAVIAQNRAQSNQVVQQSVQQQAVMAGSPQPYMTLQANPVSFQDKIKNAAAAGPYAGRNGDAWDGVFTDILQKSS